MTIVTVGGIKGGSGKTTVATNLACIAAGQGADVLLVDADNQETAFDFTNARKADNPGAPSYTCVKLTGASVRTEVLAMAKKYDHIIIDAGGRDTTSQRAALSVSNALLIPCKPRSFDLWAIENVAQLVEEARTINPALKASVFLNQTDPAGQGSENQDTIEELKKFPGLSYLGRAPRQPQGVRPRRLFGAVRHRTAAPASQPESRGRDHGVIPRLL